MKVVWRFFGSKTVVITKNVHRNLKRVIIRYKGKLFQTYSDYFVPDCCPVDFSLANSLPQLNILFNHE